MEPRTLTRRVVALVLAAGVFVPQPSQAQPSSMPSTPAPVSRPSPRPEQPAQATSGAGSGVGSFECPPRATCGSLRVPLDRADPRAGTTEVAYALVPRARTDQPAAGTIAVNPGGPGGAAIPLAAQFAGWLGDLTDDHDVLLMDPRGTGASGYLDCRVRPDLLTLARPERVQEMGRCGASIADRIRFYTSAAAADDLDAIRAHLGIARLGLYGLSYGTNLMTTYAVRHPDRVEAMVLSGPVPLDRDPLKASNVRATRDAVRLVCERSGGACDPHRTLTDLGRLASRLRRQPIRYPVTVNGEERTAVLDEAALVTTIYNATGDVARWGRLPAMTRDALAGNHDALVDTARSDLLRLADLREAGTTYSLAMALSVICNDWPTAFDKTAALDDRVGQYTARLAALPRHAYRPFSPTGFIDGMDESDWCLYWPDRTDRTQAPVGPRMDAPVLVLSGDLDINTPPEDGHRTAAQFVNATHLVVPNAGHVPTFETTGCTTSLTEAFFRSHRTGDTGCLRQIPPIAVPEEGSGPDWLMPPGTPT
jgi:pimeloyl-ACP methyl ester carboxylesterase